MENEITIRLDGFGYTLTLEDKPLLAYITSKVEQDIKNFTNLSEVPSGLKWAWIDAVCAEFLSSKMATGGLENVGVIVKSIQEGDTKVEHDNTLTPEGQLKKCLDSLKLKTSELVKYRVLVW